MHTQFHVVMPMIKVIRQSWTGRIGVYPDFGVYEYPRWKYVDIDEVETKKFVEEWLDAGVSMIGGCCGLGPSFIKFLRDNFRNN